MEDRRRLLAEICRCAEEEENRVQRGCRGVGSEGQWLAGKMAGSWGLQWPAALIPIISDLNVP